jgi:tetratricopeptide (TPR) repeat protein
LDPSFERWKAALKYLEQSIEIDPKFVLFDWSLAVHWRLGQAYSFISFKEAIAGAEAAMTKGLALDRESAEMHIAAGELSLLKWDWEGARREWRRAVELAPGDPGAHIYHSCILQPLGFHDEAIAEMKKAIQIDSAADADRAGLGQTLFYARHYDDAIAVLREGLLLKPKSAYSQNLIAWVYAFKGRPVEALAEAKKALPLGPPSDNQLLLAQVYAHLGRREDALKLLDEWLAPQKGMPINTYVVAEIFSELGEKDEAFKWLEQTLKNHSLGIGLLKVDPCMDNIRSDPRFREYLKKAGFEK